MLNMRMDIHGDAVHATMAGDTQRHISIHLIDPELPDSPTGSPRRHADLPNELEGHAYGDVDGLNTPENVSVTLTCQRRSIAHGRARRVRGLNGRAVCMHPRAEHCERFENT